jgi:hypothetical protein
VNPSRRFTMADQQAFAAASGDANPLHMSPAWAASVFPGQVVVHGMHVLLWAMDRLGVPAWQGTLETSFLKPVLLDEDVTASRDGDAITVSARGQALLVARFSDAPVRIPAAADPARLPPQWRGRQGLVRPGGGGLGHLFPHLVAAWGEELVRALAGLSTLVGMECPGLHSMFSEFRVTRTGGSAPLSWRLLRYDGRFNRVQTEVNGAGLSGTVDAFDTAAPEAAEEEIAPPRKNEFSGQRPLIVGGSSGLGATAARYLALGGARPAITYLGSGNAARQLQDRIAAEGGGCDLVALDAGNPAAGLAQLKEMGWDGRQVYYMASPRIFRRRLETFQADDFRDFSRIYVDGFYETIAGLMTMAGTAALRVFYPSSVAVEPMLPDMLEYALAKQAGESLCAQMVKKHPGLFILVERLPRIQTRQTQSIVKVPAQSAFEAMLPIIRRMQERT